jgi:putative ABC transport system substrate-binding protein
VNKRQFITLIGGAAASWPLAARAQQADQTRRVAVMIALPEDDPELQKWLAAFRQGLERLGWSQGHNVHIDYRFAPAGAHAPALAKELLALQPDVILAFSTPVAAALQRETRTVPLVFIGIADAIAQGFVHSLAHPEGNLTGLTMYEASVSGKYLSMLKEIEPQLTHTAFLVNPATAPYYVVYLQGAKVAAPSLGVEVVLVPIKDDASNIERAIAGFARASPKGGLVVVGDSTTNAHRDLIIVLTAKHRLPAVYWNTFFVTAGGLMSYGVDWVNEFGKVAYYVDRILRGTKPADLPVQTATKFVTALNVKTARAIGLTVPAGLLVAADQVIE